ncbi:MAG TPA: ATP-dependent DNA helicase [Methylophilaceae bacterium]|nr:ATP-dependent DNA helicase [Methylophilaceae bacterium]
MTQQQQKPALPFEYVVSVRTLCDLTAKLGDLDQRFTPAPTALEGMAGHVAVTSSRDSGYQTEIPLTGEFENIFVRGRADGYDPEQNQLEEIKTYKGSIDRIPENHRILHWAQLKVYGWLFCQERELQEINLGVVYYNVSSRDETVFVEAYTAAELEAFSIDLCIKLRAWAAQEVAHREARDKALRDIAFPYAEFRTGQRQLAEAVYKTVKRGKALMVQATTGIGKTLGTMFPIMKAMPEQKLDKIFFLTAKTSGRRLGLEAVKAIRKKNPDLTIRVVELVARDKACEHPDKACHGESCPLAKAFYDKLPAARLEALQLEEMDKPALRQVAQRHEVCPYYLGQDLSNWADVVVGDYNYYFDLYALLFAGTAVNEWRVSLLVDEAHNMVDRARDMYTAELDRVKLVNLVDRAPKQLRGVLDRLADAWDLVAMKQEVEYQVYPEIDEGLQIALNRVVTRITDYLADHPTQNEPVLLDFYFDAMMFSALADSFGEHSLFDITKKPTMAYLLAEHSVLCIRNVVPAYFLRQRFATAQSSTLFSATLSPSHYYHDMLGLPDKTPFLEVESPFKPEQLEVRIARHISTKYRRRDKAIIPIVELVAKQYEARPGNYMFFASSFEYLDQVREVLEARHPAIPVRMQQRYMNETERHAFVEGFTVSSTGIAFAALGGAFGEAIDLPGERLIGAFIATLGMPQVNPINEQMRERMELLFGDGFDYAYFYPGMQKVVQAAGRVIRTVSDRGLVVLLDQRYNEPGVRKLLPNWWQPTSR